MYRTNIRDLLKTEPCPFAEDILLDASENSVIEPFLLKEEKHQNTTIDVNEIVGTNHMSYSGKPWKYLILSGERSDKNLNHLSRNPGHYFSNDHSDIHIKKVGKKLFVTGEGNNRTTIARFFFHYNKELIGHSNLSGVELTEWHVDWYAYDCYVTLKTMLEAKNYKHITIATSRKSCSGDRTIYLNNDRANERIHLKYDELPLVIESLKKDSFLKRLFGFGYHKYFRQSSFV